MRKKLLHVLSVSFVFLLIIPLILLILLPLVSFADADRIFKENSKAVVMVTAYDENGNTIGLGSGFFVRSDGAMVTNYHVIARAKEIKVNVGNKVLDVEGLIFIDEANDLVILKAKTKNMPVVKLGSIEKTNIGDHVYVIGYPLGLKTISVGLLSGIDIKKEILQTTASASPGSSGSPVFDRNSEVIGVASGGVLLPGEVRNYSFAMPVKLIKDNINNKQVTAIKMAGLEGYKKTAWYWYFLGSDYGNSGIYKKAIKAYKKAIRIDPDLPFAHSSLGMAYHNSGKYEEAIEAWKQMIGVGLGLADIHYNIGLSYYKSGMYKEAIDAYLKAIKIIPNHAMAHYNLAFAYNDLGMYKEEIEAYKRAIKINPDNANFHNNLGAAYVISGMYSEAIKEYNQAIRIAPDDTNIHYNLGQAYGKLGKYKEAIQAWLQAIRIDHDNVTAHNDLGVAYLKLGMNKEAIQAWKQAIRIDPNDADTHYFIGRAYAKSGMNKEAIEAWKQTIKIDPDNVSAHFCLGVFANNKSSAIEQYEILKSLDPELANELFERIYK